MTERLKVEVNGKWYVVEIDDLSADPVRTVVDGHAIEVTLSSGQAEQAVTQPTPIASAGRSTAPSVPARTAPLPVPSRPPKASGTPSAIKMFTAPMPGTILTILVAVGDQVIVGDTVCILEAMKMQQSLRADWSGVVKAIHVSVGEQVSDGSPILELE